MAKRTVRVFENGEISRLTDLYLDYYPLKTIAKELNRPVISIQVKINRLGLKRDKGMSWLVHHRGRDVLKLGRTSAEVLQKLKETRQTKTKLRLAKSQKAVRTMIANMAQGMPRNDAICKAAKAGAYYSHIGTIVGLTKQGVSWVVRHEC